MVLINAADMERLSLSEGQVVTLVTESEDGIDRRKGGLRVTAYDIPLGCLGAYYPECNVLAPVAHHSKQALTPAVKGIPVRIVA